MPDFDYYIRVEKQTNAKKNKGSGIESQVQVIDKYYMLDRRTEAGGEG